jgi:dolichol kinase
MPVIVLGGLYALLRLVRVPRLVAWGVGGVVFSALTGWMFVTRFGTVEAADGLWSLALLGGAAAVVGAWWGRKVGLIVLQPGKRGQVIGMMCVFALALPAVTGVIDLAWRLALPAR